MAPRFKGLTQKEIDKLMNELDGENFADSDSDYEIENLEETVNESFEENENDELIEIPERIEGFEWNEPQDSHKASILVFTGNTGLNPNIQGLENAYEYFKLLFTNEIVELICLETNRYAEQVLELRPEDSGKRKHSPEWNEITPREIEKFLGTMLLMGHIHKDKIQDFWSTNNLLETPIF